jgi:hypothetical protein
MAKLRTSNHRLPTELGRHNDIHRKDHPSHLCQLADIGDEFHYFWVCNVFSNLRMKLLPKKMAQTECV